MKRGKSNCEALEAQKLLGNAVLREMQLHSTRSTLPESDTTAVGLLPHDQGPVTAADSYLINLIFH